MPLPALRAQQSTDTTGYGSLVLNYGPTSARNFVAAFGSSALRVRYCVSWSSGFEIGIGTFDGGLPGSLTRTTIIASSNAGAAVALPANTKDVFAWLDPADRMVLTVAGSTVLTPTESGNLVLYTGSGGGTLTLPASTALPIGASLLVRHLGGPYDIYIGAASGETINGSYVTLRPGHSAECFLVWPSYWTAGITAPPSFGRMIGEVIPLALPYLPPLCLWPDGRNVSRSSYSALFAAIGTIYGGGDGSTTFTLPDLRGRAIFGQDNLGGSLAGRITVAGSGSYATWLGAAGGDERAQGHTHGISDPGHNHTVNDPGHIHNPVRLNRVMGDFNGLNQDAASGRSGSIQTLDAYVQSAGTGIFLSGSGTGIWNQWSGAGGSQNMPPYLALNFALFAGA
jgi:microcystin-dependent protein